MSKANRYTAAVTSSASFVAVSPTATSSVQGLTWIPDQPVVSLETQKTALQNAIYAHIRALRSLRRTSVNTTEIARALGVSVSDVESTLEALKKKGVKVAA